MTEAKGPYGGTTYVPMEKLYGEEPPPPPVPPTLLEQVVGVFSEPVALFQRLAVTPVWKGALILMTALNVVVTMLWARKVDVDAMIRPILERDPRIPVDNYDTIIAMQGKMILPFALVGALLALGLISLIMALVYWAIGRGTAERQPPSFPQAFSATVVSGLVLLPKLLLLGIICTLKNIGGAKPDALSPTSLGFYVVPESLKLQSIFNNLDLFTAAALFVLFLAARHTLRLRTQGAAACVAVAAAATFLLPLLGAR